MKKSIKLIMAFAISVTFGILASCSSNYQPSADEVVYKIKSGEQLEMPDYETMLDYLEEFVEVGEDSPNDYESGQELGRMFPYFMQFAFKLDDAPQEMKDSDRYNNICRRFSILMSR